MHESEPIDDPLLGAGVLRHLRERGCVWDAPVLAFASLGSTNDHLKALARSGAREWTAAVARAQSRGRGRQGRTWVSPPGNLYLSVLLRPEAGAPVGLLPLAAGVAVADAAREWGVEARLKWPNDALVGERKLAGVLVEAGSQGGALDHAVLGMGVNLDWDPAEAPELADVATCVRREAGRAPEVAPAAAALLSHVARWYGLLLRDPRAVVAAWRESAVAWWGQRVRVEAGGQVLEGRLLELGDDGALRLRTDDGCVQDLFSGEVARLRPAPVAR